MNSQRKLVILVAVFLLGMVLIEARHAPDERKTSAAAESFDGASYLMYPDVYDKMRSVLSCWTARLAAGPSPKGPGH